jgi:Tfp pilus assembly protein PilX
MKAIMKTVTRGQGGNVLVMVLILLVVGSLILAPLLGLMGTGVMAGEIYENKTDELYAADAGVEDAIWQIQNDVPDSYPYVYPEPLVVNDKSVSITILRQDLDPTCGEELTYQILSTATGDDGASTTINTHLSVSYMDLSAFLDNAIVSDDTITLKGSTVVNGDVWLPNEEDLQVDSHVTLNGTVKDEDDTSIVWPTAEQFSSYYMEDVEGAYDPGSFIDIKDLYPKTIGPWYREGSLGVDNTGDPDTLVLEDTIYVDGNLEFIQPGASHNYTINLNGHTVFVAGEFTLASSSIGISGSGCVIAVGDVNFQPNIVGDEDDFVLVMSITGETFIHPSGDFTGCIVGDAHVQLQPGSTISWISPDGKGLNVPLGVGDDDELPPVAGSSVTSWEIS